MRHKHFRAFVSLITILAILLIGILLVTEVIAPSSPRTETQYVGTFFVSDAGESHGGFEYTASWNATMKVIGSNGLLNLTLNVGLGDALKQHIFEITQFQSYKSNNSLSFAIGQNKIVMTNITHDTIWNGTFDNYYTASWGGYAPPSEIIGIITPQAFPGLANFWYVELRLR